MEGLMTNPIAKRDFLATSIGLSTVLAAGIGSGKALAQSSEVSPRAAGTDALGRRLGAGAGRHKDIPRRTARTTRLFLTPPGWPNAIDIDHDRGRGFWVQEQRHDNKQEAAWLLDWNGKLLHTVMTNSKDTSGMCYGAGCIWSGANGGSEIDHPNPPINGVFQTDLDGKQISHRQIPFGPKDDGGACHGMAWQPDAGKIWIDANRLGSLVRIDPKTWEVDYMFLTTRMPGLSERLHGIEYDNGFIWQVTGHQKEGTTGYDDYTPGLIKYDIATGEVAQIVEFESGSCDMHDVCIYKGQLYGVDAGEHPGWTIDNPTYQRPGWPPLNSPSAGWVFKIDLI
jgi:hypothetical protein